MLQPHGDPTETAAAAVLLLLLPDVEIICFGNVSDLSLHIKMVTLNYRAISAVVDRRCWWLEHE
jgi:hypothetical protein